MKIGDYARTRPSRFPDPKLHPHDERIYRIERIDPPGDRGYPIYYLRAVKGELDYLIQAIFANLLPLHPLEQLAAQSEETKDAS